MIQKFMNEGTLWCHSYHIPMIVVIKVQNFAQMNIEDDIISSKYNYAINMRKNGVKAIRTYALLFVYRTPAAQTHVGRDRYTSGLI